MGPDLEMGQLGSSPVCLSVSPSSYWLVLVWGQDGNVRGPIAAFSECHQPGDEPYSLCFPQAGLKADTSVRYSSHVALSLASVTLHIRGISVTNCTLSPHPRSSIPLLTTLAPCTISHTLDWKTVGLGHLASATHTIVRVWTVIAASSTMPMSVATFPGTIQSAGKTIALSGVGHGSHLLGNLFLQLGHFLY